MNGEVEADRRVGPEGMVGIQRTRIVTAMVELTRERGAAGASVAQVVERSGVSRRTFYELFEDREACFLAAFEEAVQRAAARVVPAFTEPSRWRDRVRAALAAALEFIEDEPALGALFVVDALGAGPAVLERRAQTLAALVDAVDEGRCEAARSARPSRVTAEGIVGAVLGLLHARLAAAPVAREVSQPLPTGSMLALLGQLTAIVVLPYQGQAAATRELGRPVPPRRHAQVSVGDPLRDLGMRVTYRTVRVLLAIASAPGASNREVADAAGVQDPGQISKLLARLEHLGLTSNGGRGNGYARGEPNAWTLTHRGEQVAEVVALRSAA